MKHLLEPLAKEVVLGPASDFMGGSTSPDKSKMCISRPINGPTPPERSCPMQARNFGWKEQPGTSQTWEFRSYFDVG